MRGNPEKIATIRRMWTEGATYREISDTVALSTRTVETIRRQLGLPIRNAGHFVRERKKATRRDSIRCLCCGRRFETENKSTNRICVGCKGTKRWRGGQDFSIAMGVV